MLKKSKVKLRISEISSDSETELADVILTFVTSIVKLLLTLEEQRKSYLR